MRDTWDFMFEGRQFPESSQYLMVGGSMYFARSAPLLEDSQLQTAASRFMPIWPEGYVSCCRDTWCLDAYALERILPTLVSISGLNGTEAPDRRKHVRGRSDNVAGECALLPWGKEYPRLML